MGKSDSRKSAIGNSILCQPVFEFRLGAQTMTRSCQVAMACRMAGKSWWVRRPSSLRPRSRPRKVQGHWRVYYYLYHAPTALLSSASHRAHLDARAGETESAPCGRSCKFTSQRGKHTEMGIIHGLICHLSHRMPYAVSIGVGL